MSVPPEVPTLLNAILALLAVMAVHAVYKLVRLPFWLGRGLFRQGSKPTQLTTR